MTDSTDWEIDSNGFYVATRSAPFAAGLLLRQPVPQLPLFKLAQLSNMAAPSSRGGQGGRRLTKGAGGRAESPGAA